ncbi:hypothetical protein FRB98_002150 [Tulasnella sp. 332]|nr:hypothetical protein FRB98_002150 [Tulasnella sp. 332]
MVIAHPATPDVDETATPAATSVLPSISARRVIIGRAPRPDLNKPLPEPPSDDASSEAGNIRPGVIVNDEKSVASSGYNTPLSLKLDSDIALETQITEVGGNHPSIDSEDKQSNAGGDHSAPDLQNDHSHLDDTRDIHGWNQRPESPESMTASGEIGVDTADPLETTHLPAAATSIEKPLPSASSKGKGRAAPEDEQHLTNSTLIQLEKPPSGSVCGICGEGFRKTYNPLKASLSASGSSDPVLYGLSLTCPGQHEYCLSCMTSYLRIKLEGESGAIFPIRCPECPRDVTWELGDEMAMGLLGKELLDAWFFQRLLASLPVFYCPNPKCSAPIEEEVDDPDLTQIECPSCKVDMCFHCRTLWHPDVSCEYNQNPKGLEGEMLLKQLAEQLQWRRCPRCRYVVERTAGCRHMTCRCGFQYCHLCGSPWQNGVCSRSGDCTEWVADKTWKLGEKVQEFEPLFEPPSPTISWVTGVMPRIPGSPTIVQQPPSPFIVQQPVMPPTVGIVHDWIFDQRGRFPSHTAASADSAEGSNAPLVHPIPLPSPPSAGPEIVSPPHGWSPTHIVQHPTGNENHDFWRGPIATPSPLPAPSYDYAQSPSRFVCGTEALMRDNNLFPSPADDEVRRRQPDYGWVCGNSHMGSPLIFIPPTTNNEHRWGRESPMLQPIHQPTIVRISHNDSSTSARTYLSDRHDIGNRTAEAGDRFAQPHWRRHPVFDSTQLTSTPPVLQMPPPHEISAKRQRPRPISNTQLETELTTSYSRQHRARRVYADQHEMDSTYRPVEDPVPPRPPRPTRQTGLPPLDCPVDPGFDVRYHHPQYWFDGRPPAPEPQEDWKRAWRVVPAANGDNEQARLGREEAEPRSDAAAPSIPRHSIPRPIHVPAPLGSRAVWEQPPLPSLPPSYRLPTYLSERQPTISTPQVVTFPTRRDRSVEGGRGRSKGDAEALDTGGEGGGQRKRKRFGRPPLSKSARLAQESSRERPTRISSSSRPNPPTPMHQSQHHTRSASETPNFTTTNNPAEPPNNAPLQRGRSLRERLTSLVKRTPSQDSAWRLERERGLAEGPASACLGYGFSRENGYHECFPSFVNSRIRVDQRTPFLTMLRGG